MTMLFLSFDNTNFAKIRLSRAVSSPSSKRGANGRSDRIRA